MVISSYNGVKLDTSSPTMPAALNTKIIVFCLFLWVQPLIAQDLADSVDAPPDDVATAVMDAETDVITAIVSGPRDIMLVLDNSGSMKQHDPGFLSKQAVAGFVSQLDASVHLGIMLYDQNVQLALPLTEASRTNRERIIGSLDAINYGGLFSNSPAAVERAVYELKSHGRAEANKYVVFMTDGQVDTGNEDKDAEQTAWLLKGPVTDAVSAGIRISAIAFTVEADRELVHVLAKETGGQSLSAETPEALVQVFAELQGNLQPGNDTDLAGSVDTTSVVQALPGVSMNATTVDPASAITTSTVAVPPAVSTAKGGLAVDNKEHTRSIIIMITSAILFLALCTLIYLLFRRSRQASPRPREYITEAYLKALQGHTDSPIYKLGKKPAMIGRVAGKDTELLDYIVIPQATIGRRHALIEFKDYAFWIMDQGSINGTFVNDIPVSSEVRLKHGDRVRLHKVEFEFVVPELDDAGMTMVSDTLLAGHAPLEINAEEINADDVDAESIRRAVAETPGGAGLDFDFSDAAKAPDADDEVPYAENSPGSSPAEDRGSDDETLMPGYDMPNAAQGATPNDSGHSSPDVSPHEDETIMPGYSDHSGDFEDDPTLRPDGFAKRPSDIFDVTGDSKDEEDRGGS